jgi:rhodanese-related sulfurtransferase
MDTASFFLYTGISAALYSIVAGAMYYTYSGPQLVSDSKAGKLLKDGAVVIDVRTPAEYRLGHYKGAKSIPLGKIGSSKIPAPSKTHQIVVYCNTGQRARMASEKLESRGYENVSYIAGTYKSIRA